MRAARCLVAFAPVKTAEGDEAQDAELKTDDPVKPKSTRDAAASVDGLA